MYLLPCLVSVVKVRTGAAVPVFAAPARKSCSYEFASRRTGEASQRLRHAVTGARARHVRFELRRRGHGDPGPDRRTLTFRSRCSRSTPDACTTKPHAFIESVRQRYGLPVHLYAPDAADIEPFVAARTGPIHSIGRWNCASNAANCARCARSRAPLPARTCGSRACAATSRTHAPTRRSSPAMCNTGS